MICIVSAFEPYLQAWRERAGRQETERLARIGRGRQLASKLARLLVERYAVRRVILFGSTARGDGSLYSDLDLAVEGLEGSALFRAGAELEDAVREITAEGGNGDRFHVDLVPIEDASPDVRERAAAEGIVLHG